MIAIDPSAVMRHHAPCKAGHPEPLCFGCRHEVVHPCEPYRLAEALAAEQAENRRLRNDVIAWLDEADLIYQADEKLRRVLDRPAAIADPPEPWPCSNYHAPHTCLTTGCTTPCDHCVDEGDQRASR